MELGLEGKVALVTAASKGIGRAVAHRLAREGASVALNSSSEENLRAARDAMPDVRERLSLFPADQSSEAATDAMFESVLSKYGRIDALVVSTPGPKLVPFLDSTLADWSQAYSVLVRPAVQLALAAGRQMAKQKSGAIVFITSTWLKQPFPGGVLSASMRSAISALSKQMALELAPVGVRVNQVMPGATATDRTKHILAAKARAAGTTEAEEAEKALRDIPLKRWAQPDEIASAIVFLLSPASGFTTGATLQLDGGSTRSTL